jgi:serine/threonine-protein kinase
VPLAKGDFRLRHPQILPGGKAVIFTATRGGSWDNANVDAFTLADHKRKTLISGGYSGRYLPTGDGSSGHLVYVSKGSLYARQFDAARLEASGPAVPLIEDLAASVSSGEAAFDFSRTGTFIYLTGASGPQRRLAWLYGDGKTEALPAPPRNYLDARLSPDGRKIAVTIGGTGSIGDAESSIWIYDLERDNLSALPINQSAGWPVWAPDSQSIAFRSDARGVNNIWWIRADGSAEPRPLTNSKNVQAAYSFSRDGKRLAFAELDPDRNADLWTLPIDWNDPSDPKPGKPELFLATKASESRPIFSPDGRWLAFASGQTFGGGEVLVRPFPIHEGQWPISSGGGDHPVWARDAPLLFWQAPNGALWVAPYTVVGNTFVPGKARLWSDKPRYRTESSNRTWDVAADGKRVLVILNPGQSGQAEGGTPPTHVNLLLNFFNQVRQQVPLQ